MDKNNERIALLIASILLQYPDLRWFEDLKEIEEEIEEIKDEIYTKPILEFLNYASKVNELDLAEIYVNTFDFTKQTNLYLTYYNFQNEQERGAAILKLKQLYLKEGFQMAESELPDFLPAVLEFTAISQKYEILMEYVKEIQNIFNNLHKNNNPYLLVLKTILFIMGIYDTGDKGFYNTFNTVDYDSLGGVSV